MFLNNQIDLIILKTDD